MSSDKKKDNESKLDPILKDRERTSTSSPDRGFDRRLLSKPRLSKTNTRPPKPPDHQHLVSAEDDRRKRNSYKEVRTSQSVSSHVKTSTLRRMDAGRYQDTKRDTLDDHSHVRKRSGSFPHTREEPHKTVVSSSVTSGSARASGTQSPPVSERSTGSITQEKTPKNGKSSSMGKNTGSYFAPSSSSQSRIVSKAFDNQVHHHAQIKIMECSRSSGSSYAPPPDYAIPQFYGPMPAPLGMFRKKKKSFSLSPKRRSNRMGLIQQQKLEHAWHPVIQPDRNISSGLLPFELAQAKQYNIPSPSRQEDPPYSEINDYRRSSSSPPGILLHTKRKSKQSQEDYHKKTVSIFSHEKNENRLRESSNEPRKSNGLNVQMNSISLAKESRDFRQLHSGFFGAEIKDTSSKKQGKKKQSLVSSTKFEMIKEDGILSPNSLHIQNMFDQMKTTTGTTPMISQEFEEAAGSPLSTKNTDSSPNATLNNTLSSVVQWASFGSPDTKVESPLHKTQSELVSNIRSDHIRQAADSKNDVPCKPLSNHTLLKGQSQQPVPETSILSIFSTETHSSEPRTPPLTVLVLSRESSDVGPFPPESKIDSQLLSPIPPSLSSPNFDDDFDNLHQNIRNRLDTLHQVPASSSNCKPLSNHLVTSSKLSDIHETTERHSAVSLPKQNYNYSQVPIQLTKNNQGGEKDQGIANQNSNYFQAVPHSNELEVEGERDEEKRTGSLPDSLPNITRPKLQTSNEQGKERIYSLQMESIPVSIVISDTEAESSHHFGSARPTNAMSREADVSDIRHRSVSWAHGIHSSEGYSTSNDSRRLATSIRNHTSSDHTYSMDSSIDENKERIGQQDSRLKSVDVLQPIKENNQSLLSHLLEQERLTDLTKNNESILKRGKESISQRPLSLNSHVHDTFSEKEKPSLAMQEKGRESSSYSQNVWYHDHHKDNFRLSRISSVPSHLSSGKDRDRDTQSPYHIDKMESPESFRLSSERAASSTGKDRDTVDPYDMDKIESPDLPSVGVPLLIKLFEERKRKKNDPGEISELSRLPSGESIMPNPTDHQKDPVQDDRQITPTVNVTEVSDEHSLYSERGKSVLLALPFGGALTASSRASSSMAPIRSSKLGRVFGTESHTIAQIRHSKKEAVRARKSNVSHACLERCDLGMQHAVGIKDRDSISSCDKQQGPLLPGEKQCNLGFIHSASSRVSRRGNNDFNKNKRLVSSSNQKNIFEKNTSIRQSIAFDSSPRPLASVITQESEAKSVQTIPLKLDKHDSSSTLFRNDQPSLITLESAKENSLHPDFQRENPIRPESASFPAGQPQVSQTEEHALLPSNDLSIPLLTDQHSESRVLSVPSSRPTNIFQKVSSTIHQYWRKSQMKSEIEPNEDDEFQTLTVQSSRITGRSTQNYTTGRTTDGVEKSKFDRLTKIAQPRKVANSFFRRLFQSTELFLEDPTKQIDMEDEFRLCVLDGELNPRFRIVERGDKNRPSTRQLQILRTRRDRDYFFHDFFHMVCEMRKLQFFMLMTFCFFFVYFFFGVCYWILDQISKCEVGLLNLWTAFMFSMETQSTIGYGVPDPFFNKCPEFALIIFIQTVFGLAMDAFLIGVLYTRVSQANMRAASVFFSSRACIREIDGKLFFTFQVVEMRQSQLIEAHMRCYVYRHHLEQYDEESQTFEGLFFQQSPMRLQSPNDDLGAPMFIALPEICLHEMDKNSPLVPDLLNEIQQASASSNSGKTDFVPSRRVTESSQEKVNIESDTDTKHPNVEVPALNKMDRNPKLFDTCDRSLKSKRRSSKTQFDNKNLLKSTFNSTTSNACDVCGISFENTKSLQTHILYSAKVEQDSEQNYGHASLLKDTMRDNELYSGPEFKEKVRSHLETRWFEVVCLLEGIEPMTGNTMQSQHSYTIDDIDWDHTFVPCVELTMDGGCKIDFELFDDTYPLIEEQISNDGSGAWSPT